MIADRVCWIKTDESLSIKEKDKRVNNAIEKLFMTWQADNDKLKASQVKYFQKNKLKLVFEKHILNDYKQAF